jgi:hypothetical protein
VEVTNPIRKISEMFCYPRWVPKMGKCYLVLVNLGSDLIILVLDL